MKLILITSPHYPTFEIDVLEAACQLGIDRIHIRKPKSSHSELLDFITKLSPQVRSMASLHYEKKLAYNLGFSGYHFSNLHSRKILNDENKIIEKSNKLLLSTSFHYLDEINTQSRSVDYAFCSPVFPSISKQGYTPIFQWNVNNITRPIQLFALGGVDIDKVQSCRERGFDGVAILGCVWRCTTREEAIHTLIKIKEKCDQ